MKESLPDPESVSVTRLPGVGSQIALRLEKLGIRSIADLLFHLPFRYEDRTRVVPIGAVLPGRKALVEGLIESAEILDRPRRTLILRIADGSGFLNLRFFHFNTAQRSALSSGNTLRFYGEVRSGYHGPEMIHPEYRSVAEGRNTDRDTELTPIYSLTEGIRQPLMRRLINRAVAWWKSAAGVSLPDWLPASISEAMGFPGLEEAVDLLHAPPAAISSEQLSAWTHPAQQRLIFEELIAHYLCLSEARLRGREKKAKVFRKQQSVIEAFLRGLPFQLTSAQGRVIDEIHADLASGHPMMRLVHGDVGSGKTVVAACSALAVLAESWQVAVMAPTELLAEQHFRNFGAWLAPLGFSVGFLSSSQTEKTRRETLQMVRDREIEIIVGTHALFQESVEFSRLGLVVIDEQHRFGVHQRLALRDKGLGQGCFPHQLVMTATPIPRTLAMLRFADLDISVIDELPPGRSPVTTSIIPSTRRGAVIERIAARAAQGRQAYWVCTLIDESEFLQCEAAEKTAEKLAEALPGLRVGLVHGRMTSSEKESVMHSFKEQRVDLLVATTVIEVGVDVPNADLMVIENPERLGLAQLHQLRGRVGRGSGGSFCLLLYQTPLSRQARERLSVLRETNDGFRIAEKDLELRGPGELLGTRQTGQIQFRLADLGRDRPLMEHAVAAAQRIQAEYPNHTEPLIRRWIGDASRYSDV
ncbi:MAG: ATP-dependent DNA helicase RecG [Methylococcaceae bacterium]|nr:ATP-dependent DNA helicase RecG [Methylococcaceae bacterium]